MGFESGFGSLMKGLGIDSNLFLGFGSSSISDKLHLEVGSWKMDESGTDDWLAGLEQWNWTWISLIALWKIRSRTHR